MLPKKFKNNAIIISGYPKSGTTLFASLFDGHEEMLVFPHELKMYKVANFSQIADKKNFIKNRCRWLLDDALKEKFHNRDHGELLDFEKVVFARNLDAELKKSTINAEIALSPMIALSTVFEDKAFKYWVEKTPSNYGYVKKFRKWFGENCIFFHVKRNPHDCYASHNKFCEKFKSKKLPIRRFCIEWMYSNMIADFYDKKNDNFHIVTYENLVQSPKTEMKRVCEEIGIDFQDVLLSPTFIGKKWVGNSMHDKKFVKISSRSVNKYQKELSKKDTEKIDYYLQGKSFKFNLELKKRSLVFRSKMIFSNF